ncbi:hypothetical protein ACFLTB_07590, partial [Chloroflexota bacterium]
GDYLWYSCLWLVAWQTGMAFYLARLLCSTGSCCRSVINLFAKRMVMAGYSDLPPPGFMAGGVCYRQNDKKGLVIFRLNMLPVPIIVGWFLAAGKEGEFLKLSFEYIGYFAPGIGLSFLVLAATVAAFIRLRQRWLKVSLLMISGLLTLVMVVFYSEGRLSLPSFIVLTLIMAGLLLSPALMERRIRYGKQHIEAGDTGFPD